MRRTSMFEDRKGLLEELEEKRNSNVITYITSDRPGLSTQVAEDAVDRFVKHLDNAKKYDKLTLFLYTRGGNTLAGWRLINLLRQFYDTIEVIISFKAHSTGTLISIGADTIVMTKQATLSPIDPSITTALNPEVKAFNGRTEKIPVSVEDIRGFLDLAKTEYAIQSEEYKLEVLKELSAQIHPLVLGRAFRARTQIQMLAERLLSAHTDDFDKKQKIIDFLTSDSGSHDYTIHRKEARDSLGLHIEKPDDDLYNLIIKLHNDYADELDMKEPFDAKDYLGRTSPVELKCGFIESLNGGSEYFAQTLTNIAAPGPNGKTINQLNMKGEWKHV